MAEPIYTQITFITVLRLGETEKEALARAKQRAKFQETILKVTLAILITGVLAGAIGVLLIIARKKGII